MALDGNKCDRELGVTIHKLLAEKGVETPMIESVIASRERDYDDDLSHIEDSFRSIMRFLGLDLSDDSLNKTPRRVAKMYLNEVFWGLDYNNFPKILTIENKMQYDNMLVERHIRVCSMCEHHFIPIIGEAFVGYIPDKKVIGLSKLNRIVEYFCRRPQVQERLVEQIFHTLCFILGTENVAVLIKAEHTCVRLRGVEDFNSDTVTSKLGGAFMEDMQLRNEFFHTAEL